MRLIRGCPNVPTMLRGGAVTIGNFDGVHRGHQRMLAELRERARALAVPALLVTFEPHPLEYLRPEQAPARLTGLRDKYAALRGEDLDAVVCLRFGPALAALAAEAFVQQVLVRALDARFVLVGDDFRFGHRRRGDFDLLSQLAPSCGFALERMRTVAEAGERISSTRIRELLARGELAQAEALLGRPYCISGRVRHGDRIGRTLGFPTVNLDFRRARPALHGVFTVLVHGAAAQPLAGVASVGTRPTVGGRRPLLEVHLLDYQGDLYGRHIAVEFKQRLRGEERYQSLEALRQQIGRDVEAARAYFAQSGRYAGESHGQG